MLTYNLTNIGSDSLYEYLYKCIKKDIILGNIKPGEWSELKKLDNLGGSLFIMAKITNEQKIEIYNKRKMGYTLNMLSTEYNINVHGIEYLVRLIDKNGFDVLRKDRNRYYSPKFKEKVLRRVFIDGESITAVAIDIGLSSRGILANWIKSYVENGYNIVEKKRGQHDKQKEKNDTVRNAEKDQGTGTSEPSLTCRERILKKIGCLSYGTKEERTKEIVKAITELRQELNLSLAFILDTINSNEDLPHIAKSVYYYTLSKIDKDDKNDEIMVEIINIFYTHKERYGYRRIHLELLNKGYKVSHGKVKRLMSRMGLYAFNPTPKQRYNSYKGDMNGVCKNLLLERKKNKYTGKINEKRNFEATSVNQKWTTDVSEFKIAAGKLYLSPIMDIYNREIVGFDISDTPNLFQIYRMLDMAFEKFDNLEGLIFHSDQGWQYQHFSYHKILEEKGIFQSMSRKGNCLDNSPMENFFGKMKNEMFYGFENTFESLDNLKQAMIDYIHYHNNFRITVKGKGLTPLQIRNQALSLS